MAYTLHLAVVLALAGQSLAFPCSMCADITDPSAQATCYQYCDSVAALAEKIGDEVVFPCSQCDKLEDPAARATCYTRCRSDSSTGEKVVAGTVTCDKCNDIEDDWAYALCHDRCTNVQSCHLKDWLKCAAIVAECAVQCCGGSCAITPTCVACMGGSYERCKNCFHHLDSIKTVDNMMN